MKAELGIGLIGQSFMGKAHASAWERAPRFFELGLLPRLAAVAARDGARLEAFRRRWDAGRAHADWRALIADDAVDLVDVATPNHLHAEQAIAALEAGKHVACEKPLAASLADARAMRDAAAARPGVATFVWFNYRRCPAVGMARRLIRAGRLGRILHVRARYLQGWGGPATPMSWRFEAARAGSGAHGDLNAHSVDLARHLTGLGVEAIVGANARTFVRERVDAATGARRPVDVDDALQFLADLEGGATGSFEASRVAAGHQNGNVIEIDGERGSLRWDFEDMNVLLHHDREGEASGTAGWKRILCATPGVHPHADGWWAEGHVLGYEHGFVNMAADVVRTLAGEPIEAPLADFADAYETQRVLEAALIAARERRRVALDEVR